MSANQTLPPPVPRFLRGEGNQSLSKEILETRRNELNKIDEQRRQWQELARAEQLQLNALAYELKELCEKKKKIEGQISSYQEALETLQTKKSSTLELIENSKNDIQNREASFCLVQDRLIYLNKEIAELESRLPVALDQADEWADKYQVAQDELQKKETYFKTLQKRIEALIKERLDKEERLEQLGQKAFDQKMTEQKLLEEIQMQNAHIEILQKQNTDKEEEIRAQGEQLEYERNRSQELSKIIEQLTQKALDIEEQCEVQRASLNVRQKKNDQLEKQKDALKKTIEAGTVSSIRSFAKNSIN